MKNDMFCLEVQGGEESLADPEAGQLTRGNPLRVQPGTSLHSPPQPMAATQIEVTEYVKRIGE